MRISKKSKIISLILSGFLTVSTCMPVSVFAANTTNEGAAALKNESESNSPISPETMRDSSQEYDSRVTEEQEDSDNEVNSAIKDTTESSSSMPDDSYDTVPELSETPESDNTEDTSSVKPEVSLSEINLTLIVGESHALTVKIDTSDTEEQSDEKDTAIVWKSSAPEFASVDENGNVTALKEGEAIIDAAVTIGNESYDPLTCTVSVKKQDPVLTYQAHVQNIGWQENVQSGEVAGTTGRNLAMEAFRISISDMDNLNVQYSAHVRDIGWQNYVGTNEVAGTTGRNLSMEAVRIKLTGDEADNYDIYYRAHVTNFGWLDWASNGQEAGSEGFAYSLQAIEIRILPKGSPDAPTNIGNPNIEKLKVYVNSHVQNIGWQGKREIGGTIGTTGKNLNLEALQLSTNGANGIGIEYQAHVRDKGWQTYVQDGKTAGTTGANKPIEAIKIKLTGEKANQYDIYYRAHITNLGWLDWAKNDIAAGSTGLAYSVQALEIVIVTKGAAAPGAQSVPLCGRVDVVYSTYGRGKGWQANVNNGNTSGTTGQALPLTGLKVNIPATNMGNLGVKYSAHVSDVGWVNDVNDGAEAGIPTSNQSIESVKIQLTGTTSKHYDVWYRAHASSIGWMGWTKNGNVAGTTKLACPLEAIQIIVRPKGSPAPGSTKEPYLDSKEGWTYINGLRRYKDKKGNILNDVSSIFNPSSKYITVDRKKGITTIYGYNSQTKAYDTPIKSMLCSVGNPIFLTKAGTYQIGWQMRVKEMNASDGSYRCWAPYVSQIYGLVYFHGVASNTPDLRTVTAGSFLSLGTPQSHGCVRLAAIDAKWIYYNTSSGTTVNIGDNLASPMTPIRYAWRGGAVGVDPTYS